MGLTVYILGVNFIAFLLFGMDKKRAERQKWRISERTLMLSAAAGGSVGAFFGMYYFHHKTRKPKFRIGVPVLLTVQIVLLWYFHSVGGFLI